MSRDLRDALALLPHPSWSWDDLQRTPEGVLRFMDAVTAARAQRSAARRGTP